jgi:hypothetical protein
MHTLSCGPSCCWLVAGARRILPQCDALQQTLPPCRQKAVPSLALPVHLRVADAQGLPPRRLQMADCSAILPALQASPICLADSELELLKIVRSTL